MAGSSREVALKCLLAGERQGAWSDGYLRNAIRQAGLTGRDAALCTRLAFGVLQNEMLLDWHIGRFSSVAIDKMDAGTRNCLRLGAYQILFLDRVPIHAAVNESVDLAKKYAKNPRAAGLVNAVLRAFDREIKAGLPQPQSLSVRYSHPEWLVKEFSFALSEAETEQLLAADNAQPPTQAQINTLKTSTELLLGELREEGIPAAAHPWLPYCVELEGAGNLEAISAFQEGRFYVQDAAAKLAVMAAGVRPTMKVLDSCAAPGGKSFAAAIAVENKGSILSCDLHPHKKKLIEAGAMRLGLSCISAATMDAKEFHSELERQFDVAIVDVPCSGLGIIRKKPDIRYKDPNPLAGLPQIQGEILANVSRYVRPGGVLLYSTCTVLQRENEDVVADFLKNHQNFALEGFALPGPIGTVDGMITLWPHRHGTDGFFIAKLRCGK